MTQEDWIRLTAAGWQEVARHPVYGTPLMRLDGDQSRVVTECRHETREVC
jgi:hypothetical protein